MVQYATVIDRNHSSPYVFMRLVIFEHGGPGLELGLTCKRTEAVRSISGFTGVIDWRQLH